MRSSSVVVDADSHCDCSGEVQNLSGLPKEGCWAAMLRHRCQLPPSCTRESKSGGVWWSPQLEFSTSEPLVTKTRSFSVRSTPPSSPPLIQSTRRATFFSEVISNCTSMTRVSNRTRTPWSRSQLIRGKARDSYWLYRVNFSELKLGRPSVW